MEGRVAAAAAAAERQRAFSQSPSSPPPTKKISFSFGSKTCVSTRGSSAPIASTLASLPSSTSAVRSSSFKVTCGSGRSSRSTTTPCGAATRPKEVPSIFCNNDESGSENRSRATQQVLSFDKYSGWEEKTADDAGEKREKTPLVIPCLHPLTPPRRVALKSEETKGMPATEACRAAAFNATPAETDETSEEIVVGRGHEARVSPGGHPAALGRTEAAAAGKSESPAGERGAGTAIDGKAAAGEQAPAEGGRRGDEDEKRGEKEERETSRVHPAAACGGASGALRKMPRGQAEAVAANAEQNGGGQTTSQELQEERKKGFLQYGLIKRGAASRLTESRSCALAEGRGRETSAPSTSTSLRKTTSGLCAGHLASAHAAVADSLAAAGADDADDLAARALIAEAKGGSAAAATTAWWDAAEAARDAVPILARNAELAALRRKFRQRMQSQQEQQRQPQQQQSEQTQEEAQHEQQLQQRQCRGRGAAFYERPDVFPGSIDFLNRSQGDRYTWGRAAADVRNARSYGHTGSTHVEALARGTAADAGGHSGNVGGASSAVVGTATAFGPAAGDDRGRKDVFVNGSIAERGGTSQKQQHTTFSREEAEKELLRQELDLLPDAPQAYSAAYAAVPVSEFGIAMLRGMGYDPAAATAKTAAVGEEEQKNVKKRIYTRAGLGSETEVDRLWTEREKKLKEEAMKEKKRKLEEMNNSRYHR